MNIQQTGTILFTENFKECAAFYQDVLELPLLFTQDKGDFKLACFDLGDAYLMVETGGVSCPSGKTVEQASTKLRLNVSDLNNAQAFLQNKGIKVDINEYDWGSTMDIYDPDGNPISIRDQKGYLEQVNG